MKIYMTDSTYRYDIEALAKAIFKTEELEETRDLDAFGPFLAIIYNREDDVFSMRVVWRDPKNETFEKHETVMQSSGDERENKRQVRSKLKHLMIKTILGDKSANILPWGTLTGIKPSKLVHEMIQSGMKREDIRRKLKNEYLISKEK